MLFYSFPPRDEGTNAARHYAAAGHNATAFSFFSASSLFFPNTPLPSQGDNEQHQREYVMNGMIARHCGYNTDLIASNILIVVTTHLSSFRMFFFSVS